MDKAEPAYQVVLRNHSERVKVQVWSAISIYVLVAIVKKQLGINRNLSEILQILSISLFEKIDMYETLTTNFVKTELDPPSNQLTLFNI